MISHKINNLQLTSNSRTGHLGFTLTSRTSKKHPPIKMSDLDFEDDIALTLDTMQESTKLFGVKIETENVGLHLNAAKTELINYN